MIKQYFFSDEVKYPHIPIHYQKGEIQSDFDIHKHDYSELIVITGGKCNHIIDDVEYTIHKGDVYVINCGVSHGFTNVENLQYYNVMFDPDKAFSSNQDLKGMAGFQALFVLEPFYRKEHQFKNRLRLDTVELISVIKLLDFGMEEYNSGEKGFESMVMVYFIAIVVFISRKYIVEQKADSHRLFSLAETIAYIEKNYMEELNLKELSNMSYLSVRHFIRVFKQNYNMTPIEYIIQLRLKQACKLLIQTQMNIKLISLEVGMTDSNYFSRAFQKKYNMSPTQYRKSESGTEK